MRRTSRSPPAAVSRARPARRSNPSRRRRRTSCCESRLFPGQLKFDLTELTVAPGQLVEIVFSNPDAMQHNFVLGAAGALDVLGAAADTLSQSPAGLAQQYIPDIPQVLFSTKLVEPGQTVTFQFRAPSEPGRYPYVCTFPAHWRVMNGILNVVQPQGRGGRGAH